VWLREDSVKWKNLKMYCEGSQVDPETDFNAPETENLMDIFPRMLYILYGYYSLSRKVYRYIACKDGLNMKSFMSNFVPVLCCMYVRSYYMYFIKDYISIDLSKILKRMYNGIFLHL